MMTKAEALAQFRELWQEAVRADRRLRGDGPARREAWNNYTDALQKDGLISARQYDTWSGPFKNPRRRNPSRRARSIPPLAKWNVYAAGDGKHSYEYLIPGHRTARYTIDPAGPRRGSGFRLYVFAVPAHTGHSRVGYIFKSPQSAVKAAADHYDQWASR